MPTDSIKQTKTTPVKTTAKKPSATKPTASKLVKNLLKPTILESGSLRLNLGAGYTRFDGFINVDKFESAGTDWVMDMEKTPWDLPDNSVSEVKLHHILEHVGKDVDGYMAIWQELYRVCVDGASLSVIVPHPRHDTFIGDPTHIRPITPIGLAMLDRVQCQYWIDNHLANTTLALYYGVDFVIEQTTFDFEQSWINRFNKGEITESQLFIAEKELNNVCLQYRFTMRVRKPT